MEMITALACSIAAVLFALLFNFWLKSRKGTGEGIARIYAIVRGRISNFWSFQYAFLIAAVVIVTVAAGFGLGWKQAAVCFAGAVTALIPLIVSSGSFANGITASYNEALSGDARQSVRAGYRSGAVLGSWITGLCLLVMCLFFYFQKEETVISYTASFALGAAIISVILHTGGEVYSSAYSLAVPPSDFTDRSGIFIAAGSDYASSYIASAAAALLLTDIAVATSGVTSTFTSEDAAKFPLMVYACGIAGSVIGLLVSRAGIGNDLSKGSDIGCIAAGLITVGGSVYFSVEMLQSRVYAWAVASGILGGLLLMEISRAFSPDSKIFMNRYKTDRNLGKHSIVIFNFGAGMISTAFAAAILAAAVIVSYMFASYYGVALCAVGLCSVYGVFAAVTGLEIAAGSSSDILNSSNDEGLSRIADILDTVSLRNGMISRSYASISGILSAFAVFCALFCISGVQAIDMMSARVFGGIILGTAAAFVLAGLLISSVRITGRVALRDIGRNDDETGATSAIRGAAIPAAIAVGIPVVLGLFAGISSLAGFILAISVTGYMLIACFNCSGIHYANTAAQALSSLIRMIAVFSVAFLPVFMEFGGILFR